VVRTIAIGNVMSAAFLIFAAGDKGERYVAKNTSIMCHQYASEMNGKYHDMKAYVRESELANTRMNKLLQECTPVMLSIFTKVFVNGVWIGSIEEPMKIIKYLKLLKKFLYF
jgi:ATP-dependent Clp protease protease subunit